MSDEFHNMNERSLPQPEQNSGEPMRPPAPEPTAPKVPEPTASNVPEPTAPNVPEPLDPQPEAEHHTPSVADEEIAGPEQAQTAVEDVEPAASASESPELSPPEAVSSEPAKATKPKKEPKKDAKAGEKAETAEQEPKSDKMDWYILKVQSNREESIKDGLLRRVAIAGMEHYFGDVIVPTEKVTEFKGGKKRVTKRKLYPGYLIVQMEYDNVDARYLVRETPGIGDFTGPAGQPSPMLAHEVQRILAKQEEKSEKAPKLKIGFSPGDQVKINEGTFENFEGEVESIDETNGRVTVMINIFGRSTPVELEYWQIGAV
jgi:transcription termination/antitermination protein NusG